MRGQNSLKTNRTELRAEHHTDRSSYAIKNRLQGSDGMILAVDNGRSSSISPGERASNRSNSVEDLTINLNYRRAEQQHQPQPQRKRQASRPRPQLQEQQQANARPQKPSSNGHAMSEGGPRGGGTRRKVVDEGASRKKRLLSDIAKISPTGDDTYSPQDVVERLSLIHI